MISPVLEDNQSEQSMMDMGHTTGVLEWVGSLSTGSENPRVSMPTSKNQHLPVITTKVMSLDFVEVPVPGVQDLTSTLSTTNLTHSNDHD